MRLIKGQTFYKKPWYNSYRCMHSRCYRTKDPSYKYYGGRGIKVCDIHVYEKCGFKIGEPKMYEMTRGDNA